MTTINVTAEHIANGVREDCERCPVALALAGAFPDLTYVAVGPEEITMQLGRQPAEIQIAAPREVLEFIWDFDDGSGGGPFTFTLDYPAVAA